MAGRAGRRGIDERGVVITMFDQRLEPERAQSIVRGSAARLTSTFHLTYSLMLNAMRTSGIDIEYVILKSFHHFQNTILVPSMRRRERELRRELRLIDQKYLNRDNKSDHDKSDVKNKIEGGSNDDHDTSTEEGKETDRCFV